MEREKENEKMREKDEEREREKDGKSRQPVNAIKVGANISHVNLRGRGLKDVQDKD